LNKIRIPFLTVQALDDPVLPKEAIPYSEFLMNPYLALITTKVGGHVGWTEGIVRPKTIAWSDRMVTSFVLSVLDHMEAAGEMKQPRSNSRMNSI
jgi:predicted alpha/beta-fold hydrolase